MRFIFIHHLYDLMYKDVLDISRCKSTLGSNGLYSWAWDLFYSSFVWSNVQGCSGYFTMQFNIGFRCIDCPVGTLRFWWVLFHVDSRICLIFHEANQHWVQVHWLPCWDFENLIGSFTCWFLYSKHLCCTSEVRLRPFLICYVQCKYKYYLSNYFDETKDVDEDEIVVKLSD